MEVTQYPSTDGWIKKMECMYTHMQWDITHEKE